MGKRGHKFVAFATKAMHRGAKFVKHVARGMKHIPEVMRQVDNFGRQAANTLGTAADYAAIASNTFGNDRLRDAGNKMAKHSESIHNFRRGELANKARDQFWTPPEES